MKCYKVVKSGKMVEIYSFERVPMSFPFREKAKREGQACRRTDNVSALKKRYKRLIWAALNARPDLPYFVTLTFRDDIRTLGEAYVLFNLAMKRFRYNYDVEYIGVPEFQKHGRVHFHVLMWGNLERAYFDFLVAKSEYLADRKIMGSAAVRRNDLFSSCWGYGFLDVVKCYDKSNKIGTYMSKYMTKQDLDMRTYGQKSYTRSRMSLHITSLWSYGFINTVQGKYIRSWAYNTEYLGEGFYILLETT